MNTKFADKVFRVLMILAFVLGTVWTPNTTARAEAPSPIIWGLTPSNNWISGRSWPSVVNIQIAINDPATPQNPDFLENQTTDASGNFSYQSTFDIKVGFDVYATDGNTIKQVMVTNFEVTSIDWISDIVTGVGTPNASAGLWITTSPLHYMPFVVDGTGNWQVELSGTYDIMSDTQGFAIEQDSDGDGTQSNWETPKFHVNPDGYANNHVDGFGWPVGTTVFLTIEDLTTPASPDYSANAIVANPDPWQTDVRFLVTGFDLQAGQVVTLTGNSMTKSLMIKTLQITEADAMSDVVRGIAEPGSVVRVNLWCRDCPFRLETVDSNGAWMADFSTPGDQIGELVYDIPAGLQIGALLTDEDHDATRFDLLVPNPHLSARLPDNAVVGREWTLGESVTLTIDDPETSQAIDYSETRTVVPRDWDPSQTEVLFNLNNFLLEPGQVLTMTNGTVTKVHTAIDLKITDVNIDTDTVSGTTNVLEGEIEIYSFGNPPTNRIINVNPDGTWLADFSIPHSSQNKISDLRPGDVSEALHYDEDGDFTLVGWRVPNPMLGVNPDGVWGIDWILGTSVTLTVDDPANGTGVDYTTTETVQMYDFPKPTAVFHLPTNFQIQPGFELTMTDGTTTKTHTAMYFEISNVDVAADIVSGVTEAGYQVQVWMSKGERTVTAGSDGIWSADFKIPGDPPNEDDIVDILPGDFVMAAVHDADGDSTGDWANANTSTFGVNINGYHPDWVDGLDWMIGELVDISIDDPGTPGSPDAYIDEIEVVACEFNSTLGCFRANFNGLYHIKVGDIVTVTQGAIAKTHEILTVEITDVDPVTDVVSGTTDPFIRIRVMAWPSYGPGLATSREVTADEFGNWSTDFIDDDPETDDYDLVSGTYVRGDRFDEDGDYTTSMGWVPYPELQASIQYDWVRAMGWLSGAEVYLTINGQDFGSAIVEEGDHTSANFDLGEYELQIGDIVTVTDGVQEKSLAVTLFEVTGIDTHTDKVSGMGTPGAQLYASVHHNGNNIWRGTTADNITGAWEVDFSGVVDIQAGSEGDAQERDDDGDATWYEWRVPEPPNFHVRPNQNAIHAFRWPEGNLVHVTVDDPSTPNPIDYEETQEAVMTEWFDDMTFMIFTVQGMTLQPGQIVTMTDGVTTKTHVIQELAITNIDDVNDLIEGTATPGTTIHVWQHNCNTCARRYPITNVDGVWVADFNSLQNPGDEVILDIVPETIGTANVRDDDGDFTTLNWSVPIDTDGDGIPDDIDNAPSIFNPDQRDVDSDGAADVLDPCPSDATNTCNTSGSTSAVVGSQGGTLVPFNGMVEINVPAGALDEFISLSITDAGGNYEIASDQGAMTVIHSYSIQPHGTHFSQPVAITFHWEDADNNGIVDETTLLETKILMIKDGLVITPSCAGNPDCDMVANELTVHVSDLSLFALAVPANHPPVADAGGPYSGNEGTIINLSASKSTDPDNNIVLYKWDLDNDGQFDDATGKKPKFKAIDNGIFTVRVRVTDAGGLSSTDDATVTVRNVPPVITSLSFNSIVRVGANINARATFKDAGVNDTFTAVWKWGDGKTSSGIVSGYTVIGSHTYTKPGIYLVTITVKDKDGGVGQTYKLIFVWPKK